MTRFDLLIVALVSLIAGCADPAPQAGEVAPGADTHKTDDAKATLQEALEGGSVPTPAVAATVYKNGERVFNAAAGVTNLEKEEPAQPETRFRLYSTAKMLTSVAAFRMAEQGVVDLEAPISEYLAGLPADKQSITLRQLLAHRGGIRHYKENEWLAVSQRACTDPMEALPDFINDPLIHEPGTETQYTSFGYVLVSAVLQGAARKPFAELMRDTVFEPAGMNSIAIEGDDSVAGPVAAFYLHPENEGAVPETTSAYDIDASCKFGGGGFVGTANDLAAFGDALLRGVLLSEASIADMTQTITPAAADGSYPPMGYGVFPEDVFPGFPDVPDEEKSAAYWHGGSAAGGYSVVIVYPKKGVAVGIAANNNAGGHLIFKAHDIARQWWD